METLNIYIMGCFYGKNNNNDDDAIELMEIYKNKCDDIIYLFTLAHVVHITTSDNEYLIYNIEHNTIACYVIVIKDNYYIFSLHGLKKFIKTIYSNIVNIMPKTEVSIEKYDRHFMNSFFLKRCKDDYFKK